MKRDTPMKTIYKISFLLILFIHLAGCSDWLDINKDPDSPTVDVITESVLLPGIEATMSFELAGGIPARYPNTWIGQYALNGLAPDIQTFKILDTDVDNTWTYTLYSGAMKNLNLLIQMADVNKNTHYKGIGQILMAYSLAVTTDLWGNVPYSQAFQPLTFPKPKFDSQEEIYTAIFKLLDESLLNLNSVAVQASSPGNEDLIYQGDLAKWKKFAYTLKARYAMRLSYVKGGSVQADAVLAALNSGFQSNSDDADFVYFDKTSAENPWYQNMSKFNILYLDTNTYIILKKYNDPRLSVFAEPAYSGSHPGQIVPQRNGMLSTIPGETSKLAIQRTQYDDGEPVLPCFITKSTPVPFITFTEACFLKAEAYLWKNDYVNAYKYLKEGTRASMIKLQRDNVQAFSGAQTDAFVGTLPPLPATFESAQKMIIELKFIANFLSLENYNDYRRTHYPVVVLPVDAQYTNVPVRLPYATSTKLSNKDNVPSINFVTDKIWWDKK
jgi:hypothetical protein